METAELQDRTAREELANAEFALRGAARVTTAQNARLDAAAEGQAVIAHPSDRVAEGVKVISREDENGARGTK